MNHFYQEVEGWFDFEELYRKAVQRMPQDARMVEVGVYQGRSLFFLTVEAINADKNIKVIGVDRFHWPAGAYDKIQAIRIQKELEATLFLVAHHSLYASAQFPDKSLDFVFLDADHTYEAVKADIGAWLPKVKKGGILAGHDFSHPDFPGIKKAVNDFFGENYFEIQPSSFNPGVSSWWIEV